MDNRSMQPRPLSARLAPARAVAAAGVLLLCACSPGNGEASVASQEVGPSAAPAPTDGKPFTTTEVARFDEPWAMTFLPGTGDLLVTEKAGTLKRVAIDAAGEAGRIGEISGVPEVDYGGQGGLGDVVLHPGFSGKSGGSGVIYLSYAEAGDGDTRGAAVARATLKLDDRGGGSLSDVEVIWRQVPKVKGRGHYGHRLAFGPDGHLWISSGERQKFDPAQDMQSNLGKIVRLDADGGGPADNPFVDGGDNEGASGNGATGPAAEPDGIAAQIWSLGHRNPLGLAFDGSGQLWSHEMGPSGGDELNRIERGGNYGYPIVSNGDHYDGREIPDHDTRPEFVAPAISWTPVISPAGLVIYDGERFPDWRGDALLGALSGQALVRVEFEGSGDDASAREAERFEMDERIREVEQGPTGDLWLLEDGEDARLLRLSPPAATGG